MMRLGVIGGLGPMATAYYLELMIRMTDAARDQEHPEIIIMNIPSIPDRTAYILGRSQEDPLPPMVQLGKQLKELGASVLATPCITAHYFHEPLQEGAGLPLIHGIRCLQQKDGPGPSCHFVYKIMNFFQPVEVGEHKNICTTVNGFIDFF